MSALRRPWVPVLVAGGAALLVASVGATMTDIGPWYQDLKKPPWQPPDWLFGPAWTLIYCLAALSAVLAWWATSARASREWIIILFALNGFLNVFWSLLFFRLKRPDWALYEVGFLWLSVLVLMIYLARHSKTASVLLVPYLLWVAFAAYLNLAVVRLNAPF